MIWNGAPEKAFYDGWRLGSLGIDLGGRENKRHLIVGRFGIAAEAVPGPRVVTRTELPPRRIIWRARQGAESVKAMTAQGIDE